MRSNKGISLIVLVITIIVMIILAGAVMLTLNNAGVLDKAQGAVAATNEAEVKQLAQLAWAEAYAEGVRTVEDKGTVRGLKNRVEDTLKANGIEVSKYLINVTTSGVTTKLLENAWIQDGLKVKKGKKELIIGANIQYDETDDGNVQVDTDVSWQVLGANEDGELLILSATDIVSSYRLGYEESMTASSEKLKETQKDWLTSVEQLDALCKPYGKGKSATNARSITLEDINKIIGYDKTKYGRNSIYAYENEVTYSFSSTPNQIDYIGSNGVEGTLTKEHPSGFRYYGGKNFVVAYENDNTGKIDTIKSNNYVFSHDVIKYKIATTSLAYKMLFSEYINKETYYWLASPSTSTWSSTLSYSVRIAGKNGVANGDLWSSTGWSSYGKFGVRAVVALDSNIQVTGDAETGYVY